MNRLRKLVGILFVISGLTGLLGCNRGPQKMPSDLCQICRKHRPVLHIRLPIQTLLLNYYLQTAKAFLQRRTGGGKSMKTEKAQRLQAMI